MKYFLLSLAMVLCCTGVLAQEWGEWINVGHQVQVSFKFSRKGCDGTSAARLRNISEGTTFCNVTVTFSKGCNGSDAGQATVSAYKLRPGEISESPGSWYNLDRANNIQLTRLTDVECKDLLRQTSSQSNNNGVSHNNGTSEIYYPKPANSEKEKEEELKRQQLKKQQEEAEKRRREQLERQRAAQQEADRKMEEIRRNSEAQTRKTNEALDNFNKSIDDITNSVVNDMQRKNEEEKRKREQDLESQRSTSEARAGIPIESLSDDRSGASASDGYFPVKSYSDILHFILVHGRGGNTEGQVNADRSSISDNGILKLVYTYRNYPNQYYEIFTDLKKIDLSSLVVGTSGSEISIHFKGSGVVQNKYYRNGKLKSDVFFDKGLISLDRDLYDENRQYILRDFMESIGRIVSGRSSDVAVRVLYPKDLSSNTVNRDPNDRFFNIRTIAGLAYFIQRHGNYDADKTTCNEDGYLSLVVKGAFTNQSSYTNDFIFLKKIDTNSFVIKETADELLLEFSGADGVFGTTLNEYDEDLYKRTGLWRYTTLKRSNKGVIRLNKELLNDNRQYLLKDFINKLKYFISTL